ncbi:unnamed protein product [Lymnaea stagnalis]|uniref:N-acetyltransferase domain-containing protein n=1 Tax=Lymnaea stagnalis TaxID=6523 RepID=A0AAV2IB05_LYMST
MGFLYVTPEARGQGLAKIISSHLANKLFSDNLPAAVTVLYENAVSLKLHEDLGFKIKCTLDILISRSPDEFQ